MVPIGNGEPTGGPVEGVSNERLLGKRHGSTTPSGWYWRSGSASKSTREMGRACNTWRNIVHLGVKIAGRNVEQVVTSLTETWCENCRRACDYLAEASSD